jgi:hypothetical protein
MSNAEEGFGTALIETPSSSENGGTEGAIGLPTARTESTSLEALAVKRRNQHPIRSWTTYGHVLEGRPLGFKRAAKKP